MSSFDGLDDEDVKLIEKINKRNKSAVVPKRVEHTEAQPSVENTAFTDIVDAFEATIEQKKAKMDKYKQVTLDIERELWEEFQSYAKLRHGFQRKFFNEMVRNFVVEVVRKRK